jgi:hypothetical protein
MDVESTDSSNNKNNSAPLFSKNGGAKNNLKTIRMKGILIILILYFLDIYMCIYLLYIQYRYSLNLKLIFI